jgi:hypothetical protein
VEKPAVQLSPRVLALFFLFVLVSTVAVNQDLPQAWRRPTKAEAADEWRNKSRSRFLTVKGDFDGDGKPDIAELLVNTERKNFAISVKLGSTGKYDQVGDEVETKWLSEMGIALVKPGRYETACGKGYDDSFCAHGEPDYLTVSNPAIDFFVEESADSMLYWDEKEKTFKKVQMSD